MTYFFDYKKPAWKSKYKNYLGAASYTGDILGVKDFVIHLSNIYSDDEIRRIPEETTQYINRYETNRLNFNIAKKFKYRSSEFQFLTEYFHNDLRTSQRMEDVDFENELSHEYMYDNRVSAATVVSFSDYLKSLPILSWKTFVGLRADFLASGDQDITQMVGAQVEYNMERWRFSPYFNYGKNVKYPTLQENAYFQDVSNSLITDSSSAAGSSTGRLKPEYNNSAELGVKIQYFPKTWMVRNIEYSLDLFSRTVYNKLITRPFDDLIANFQLGRDVTRGIETSLRVNDIFRQLSLSASFIQLDVGDPLLYAYKPKKNMSLHASYVTPFGLYLTSTFFYEGKSTAWFYDTQNNLTTAQIEPYNDMDVTAGINVPVMGSEISLQFSGYNIFDNSGFKYYYLKKKYLQVSLSVRY